MAKNTDTSMTIRMNSEVKQQAQELFEALGMDMTTAINTFLRQAIREQGFPFTPTREIPNARTRLTIKEADQGENLIGPFDSVAAVMEALNA